MIVSCESGKYVTMYGEFTMIVAPKPKEHVCGIPTHMRWNEKLMRKDFPDASPFEGNDTNLWVPIGEVTLPGTIWKCGECGALWKILPDEEPRNIWASYYWTWAKLDDNGEVITKTTGWLRKKQVPAITYTRTR